MELATTMMNKRQQYFKFLDNNLNKLNTSLPVSARMLKKNYKPYVPLKKDADEKQKTPKKISVFDMKPPPILTERENIMQKFGSRCIQSVKSVPPKRPRDRLSSKQMPPSFLRKVKIESELLEKRKDNLIASEALKGNEITKTQIENIEAQVRAADRDSSLRACA